jgi:hypothetical protein
MPLIIAVIKGVSTRHCVEVCWFKKFWELRGGESYVENPDG